MNLSRLFVLPCVLIITLTSSAAIAQVPATVEQSGLDKDQQQATALKEKHPELARVMKPFLWKIEGEKPSYLFGTIHVSDKRVLEMHPIAKEIFDNTDTLFLEVKPEEALNQMKALILPFGEKLDEMLDKETLKRLDAQLAQINPVFAGKHRPNYRIWAWPLILPNLESQLKNPKMEILDFKLGSIAASEGKYVGSLEDPSSQMKGLERLTVQEQTLFLRDALTGMEEADDEEVDYEKRITNLYLSGNVKKIEAFFEEELENDELPDELAEKILDAVLYSRNEKIAETIQKTIAAHPDKIHFFAAGTASFVGRKSVQQFLKKAGLKISRVKSRKKTEK